jgi:colicin import membrane protein
MATALKIEDTAVTGNDIVVAVTQNPGLVLLDRAKFTDFYERMKAETDKLVPDVTTNKGRDEIRSMAARVVRSKTAIEAARLELTKEWRDKTDAANAAGKEIKAQMEALADEVRKPLTEWEEAEKARAASCREIIDGMKAAAVVTLDDTADAVRQRGSEVYNTALDAEAFGDMLPEAENTKEIAVDTLKAALARLTREEADRAELERLRAENEAREAKETAEREARELAEKLAEEARQEEQRKADAEKADAERIANAEREAVEAERNRLQAEHDAALAAERAAAQAELDRVARGREMLSYIREVVAGRIGGQVQPFGVLLRELETKVVADASYGDMREEIEQARVDGLVSLKEAMERQAARKQAEEDRLAEQERLKAEHERQENKAHRADVKKAAKEAIITCGADEDTARKIVMAVLAGEIPHVRMEF